MNGIMFKENDKILNFNIIGYEFEKTEVGNDEYDANWLNVRIKYQDLEISFDQVDPCILSFELKEFIDEIGSLTKTGMKLIKTFLEPYLTFEITKLENYYNFKIEFVYDTKLDWESVYICEKLTIDELMDVKNGFKEMYDKFPER